MHHVIVAWANSNAAEFEAQVPLEFIARRYRRLGYEARFQIVVLHGYERLETDYRSRLAELGFELHDAGAMFNEMHRQYAGLDRFGSYELSCFLRWPVLHRIFGDDAFVHYDGDVVLNVPAEEVARRFAGTSFVLQGCPAFTVVSDSTWYDQYEHELAEFSADTDGYSARAWRERAGWEESAEQKWAGSRFRETISSDQDFISHLIHTGRLLQARKECVLERLGDWMAIENPLYPDAYYPADRLAYSRSNGVDRLNGRPVMMWHMQTSFYVYLARHIIQSSYSPLASRRRLPLHLAGLEYLGYRALAGMTRNSPTKRRAVYEAYFDQMDFSPVFNDRRWWKPGVFGTN